MNRNLMTYVLVCLALMMGIAVNGASLASAINTNLGNNALAKFLVDQSDPVLLADALNHFQRQTGMMQLTPPRLDRAIGLAALYAEEETTATAALRRAGLTVDDLLAYAHNAAEREDTHEAQRWYDFAVRYAPNSGDAWYYLGIILQEQGKLRPAEVAYSRGLEASDLVEIGRSDLYFGRADVRRLQRNFLEAQEDYEAALTHNQFSFVHTKAHTLDKLASIYLREARYDAAMPLLQEAITLAPSFDWPYFRLGTTYYHCCHDVERALQFLNQGIAANPNNPWGHLLSGDIYLMEGDRTTARTLYEKALEVDPDWHIAKERIAEMDE